MSVEIGVLFTWNNLLPRPYPNSDENTRERYDTK